MKITLTIRCSFKQNQITAKKPPSSLSLSPHHITIADLNEKAWHEATSFFENFPEIRFEGPPIFTDVTVYDWNFPEDDYVAAILVARDFLKPLNPKADYSEPSTWPCCNLLRQEVPANLPSAPSGLTVSIGDEDLYSSRFSKVFGSSLKLESGSVNVKGKPVEHWGRLSASPTDSVLDPSSLCPSSLCASCAICGNPYMAASGIWIARPNVAVSHPFWLDDLGSAHMARQRHLCVSIEVAKLLRNTFPQQRSLRMLPIWSYDSQTARLSRQVIQDCQDWRCGEK